MTLTLHLDPSPSLSPAAAAAMLGEEEHALAVDVAGEAQVLLENGDAAAVDVAGEAAQVFLENGDAAAVDVAGEAQVFLENGDDGAGAVRCLLLSWLPVIYLALGNCFYIYYQDSCEAKNRTFRFVDGVYLAVVSVTTVGLGDISPLIGLGAKLFQVGYIFTGLCFRDQIYAARIKNFYQHVEDKLIRQVEGQAVEGRRWWLWKGGCALAELLLIYVIGIIIIFICAADPETKEDSPYLAAISAMTVGYDDDSFKSWPGRLIASTWLPFSTVAVERFIAFV